MSTEPNKSEKSAPTTKSVGTLLFAGNGDQMRVSTVKRKDGRATSFVIHRVKQADGSFQSIRGGSSDHESFEAAKANSKKLIEAARAKGWEGKSGRGGFRAKPDAFDVANLPAAKGGSAASTGASKPAAKPAAPASKK